MTATLQEADSEWIGFDEHARQFGIYGGVPRGIIDHPLETRSGDLQAFVEICLTMAESQGQDTWRTREEKNTGEEDAEWREGNSWISRCTLPGDIAWRYITIYRHVLTGRARVSVHRFLPEVDRARILLDTCLTRSESASFEAELVAREKLQSLLTPSQWQSYVLNDCFFETSQQSGVVYLIRKNRPTIALGRSGGVLCALCLHPLAYYTGTWAGAMVPSDEMWVHLSYIRADEHRFWRMANQIPASLTQSGI